MAWNENYTSLNYLLADLYDERQESKAIVRKAGVNTGLIAFADQPYTNWFNILDGADKQNKVIPLLKLISSPPERGSQDPSVQQTITGLITNIELHKAPFRPSLAAPPAKKDELPGNLEKIMGSMSTLLPISFLEGGLISAKSVVRIEVDDGLGTGFLVSNNWIITNNHVLPDKETAENAVVQFNYQKSLKGLDIPFKEFQLDVSNNQFHTSKEDDWTIVKLNGDANKEFGSLNLSKNGVKKDDFVNIIQHPSGGPKQIALYHNTVTSTDDRYVYYLTDTMPGSSGSPVFNTAWEVVALHHWGGTAKEPYSNINVYRNRGINISVVQKAIEELKIN